MTLTSYVEYIQTDIKRYSISALFLTYMTGGGIKGAKAVDGTFVKRIRAFHDYFRAMPRIFLKSGISRSVLGAGWMPLLALV